VTSKFKLAMAQIRVDGGQPDVNMARAVARIGEAARAGCRLVVLPECMDLGWTHGSAATLAEPIPGPRTEVLAAAARAAGVYVAAGLVERSATRCYNAAVLIEPSGGIRLHHRKINVLDIEQPLYATGDRLAIAETELGVLGLNICADNFEPSLAIGHVLARMGAQVILSPSAWAVRPEFDHAATPYEEGWLSSYRRLCGLYDISVVGVSNVGVLNDGPWTGRDTIGRSLAVGPGGRVLAIGPFGRDAEALVPAEISPQPREATGTDLARMLRARGYAGH
jgi:predicted amidohydrolase